MSNICDIAEHAYSFIEIAAIIRTEASANIDAISLAISDGTDEEIILKEWNSVFESESHYYETLDELLEWLRTVGI